jgi:hypothetical protein
MAGRLIRIQLESRKTIHLAKLAVTNYRHIYRLSDLDINYSLVRVISIKDRNANIAGRLAASLECSPVVVCSTVYDLQEAARQQPRLSDM